MKRVAIYTRVSTLDQHPEMQEEELVQYVALRNWTLYQTYRGKGVSGIAEKRPGLDALMDACRRRKVDVVVVYRFDRFARSVSHLLRALETFEALGIEFISLSEQVDTSTPTGKMVFTVLGAVAELERGLIAERVRSGLQHARSQGRRLGRPPGRVLTPEEIRKLRKERGRSKTPFRTLAKKYGVSVFTAHTLCARRD